MGKYNGTYEKEYLGRTLTISVTSSAATKKLVSKPEATGPKRFELHTTKAAHFRQGASDVPDATTSDFRLPDDGYKEILVDSAQNNHLSVIRASEDGTAHVTEKTAGKPGSGASGDSANPFDDD